MIIRRLVWLLLILFIPNVAWSDLRLVSYHAGLSATGPGLVLQKIRRGDRQVLAIAEMLASLDADILFLSGLDLDAEGLTSAALQGQFRKAGLALAYLHAPIGNHGLPSGLDLNGNGRLGDAQDNWGYGRFPGAGGMALFSRFPIVAVVDHSKTLWRDVPDSQMPEGLPPQMRLSSVAHWQVELATPDGKLELWLSNPTPPVFDGPDDRNGRRNRDEVMFWVQRAPNARLPFVVMGNLNIDPIKGEGRRDALRALLDALQDAVPHRVGDPSPSGSNTADWREPVPGDLRVDYILPAPGIKILQSGVFWPETGQGAAWLQDAESAHRPVWMDIRLP